MAVSHVICAAGLGSRMRAANERIPKPLLKLRGYTFLERSIACLETSPEDQLIVIGLEEHELERLAPELESRLPKPQVEWLALSAPTSGQLATARAALPIIPKENSIAIFNADSVFTSPALYEAMKNNAWDGLIACSIESGDAWSFCSVENESIGVMRTNRVTEKERISKWCSVGHYFFRNRDLFDELSGQEIEATRGEAFVAPLYNRYLKLGKSIGVVRAESFKAMGTPEQLQAYWGISMEDLRKENL
jgi:NDP-sugar pyrophosphorylase family protein